MVDLPSRSGGREPYTAGMTNRTASQSDMNPTVAAVAVVATLVARVALPAIAAAALVAAAIGVGS